jgi:hypothetical protein
LDRSAAAAQRRLRTTIERWYGRPFEMIASLQALYAGTPEGLSAHLDPYVQAGVRYVVLRLADEPRRGLDAAGAMVQRLGSARTAGRDAHLAAASAFADEPNRELDAPRQSCSDGA